MSVSNAPTPSFNKPGFPQPPTDKEKVSYANPSSVGLSLSTVLLLIAFSLGGWYFVQNNPAALALYAVFVVLFSLGLVWSCFLYLIVEKLDVDLRRGIGEWFVTKTGYYPSVDVFLPSFGEDLDLLDNNYFYVSQIDYKNYKVYVLDDSARPEVKFLAEKYKFEYICRPEPGKDKKAGNLRYAYPRTSGELILVLDADMCPRHDMLTEMVWEFGKNPKLGILQTPHYFRVTKTQPAIERGASLLQEVFYRVYQPAWNKFGASICCGSNAIYKREALAENNGPALISRSEDVCTGLVVIKYGYSVKYVNLALAAGLSPSTLRSFVNQLYRWAAGSFQTRSSKFLWNRHIPNKIKFIYFSSVLYFSTSAVGVVGFGIPGIINLLFYPEDIWISNYLYVVPAIIISMAVKKRWSVLSWDFSILYNAFILGYISLVGIYDFCRGDIAGWVPTNQKRSKGSSYDRFIFCIDWIPTIGLALCLVGLVINYDQISSWAWVPAVGFWVGKFWLSRIVLAQDNKEEELDKFYSSIYSYNQEESVKTHYSKK